MQVFSTALASCTTRDKQWQKNTKSKPVSVGEVLHISDVDGVAFQVDFVGTEHDIWIFTVCMRLELCHPVLQTEN